MARSGASRRHVALLRGINVGGRNKLPMKTLVGIFEGLGCGDVTTWIQSGNVVFSAAPRHTGRLAARVSRGIAEAVGLDVPVVLRSADELAAIVENNPFVADGADERGLHVMFLADRPAAAQIAALDAGRSPPDEFRVLGREVYLSCPNGVARTKLTNAYFDARLSTVSTSRNWRTVQKLLELSRG